MSSGCSPCCCWNLKDGCITIGVWTLIYSIVQLAIFGWQTAEIKYQRDKAANWRLPSYGSYDPYAQHFPGYYERYYETDEERFYLGLFVVQIIKLVADFSLLFSSVGLVYGVHSNSKHLVWPWFPSIAVSMLTSLAYCIMWWAFNVNSYWIVITIFECLTVIINTYCLICVVAQYRRIVAGKTFDYYPEKKPREIIVYETDTYPETRAYYGERRPYDFDYGEENHAYTPPLEKHVPSVQVYHGRSDDFEETWTTKKQPPSFVDEFDEEPQRVAVKLERQRQRLQSPALEEIEQRSSARDSSSERLEPPQEALESWNRAAEEMVHLEEAEEHLSQEPAVDIGLQTEFATDISFLRSTSEHQLVRPEKKRRHRSHDEPPADSETRSWRSRASSATGKQRREEVGPVSEVVSKTDRSRERTSKQHDRRSKEDTSEHRRHHRRSRRDSEKESKGDKVRSCKAVEDLGKYKTPRDVKYKDHEKRSEREKKKTLDKYETRDQTTVSKPNEGVQPTVVTPDTSPQPLASSPEQFLPPQPSMSSRTITIPQHIVIPDPSRLAADGRPRRFQINSEIVISYGNNRVSSTIVPQQPITATSAVAAALSPGAVSTSPSGQSGAADPRAARHKSHRTVYIGPDKTDV